MKKASGSQQKAMEWWDLPCSKPLGAQPHFTLREICPHLWAWKAKSPSVILSS